MASFNKIIQFDANEIERCSQVKNGVISWIPERQPVADKVAYTELLFPKLIQAVSGRSSFSMAEKPKLSGKSNGVLYVYCDHLKPLKIRQGVFYELKEHSFTKPLVLTFKQKCLDCEGLNAPQPQMIPEVAPHHVRNDLPPQQVNLEVSSDFVGAIESIDVKLIEFVEQVKRECLLHPNPLQFLINKAAVYGLLANKAVIEAIQGISVNIDNSGSTSAANSGDLGNVTTVPPLSALASTVSTDTAATSNSTTVTQVHVTPMTSTHPFIAPVSPAIIAPTVTVTLPTGTTPTSTEITPVTTAAQHNTSITPTYVSRTLRSAERAATEAAQNASGDGAVGTPVQKGLKRSSRALLAQKKQEGNIQKKSRGI